MGVSFGIVWGVALLVIGILALLVALTLRGPKQAEPETAPGAQESGSVHDTLLFDFGEQTVRSTTRGHVIIRVSGAAWRPAWQEDLIRVEVNALDPAAVLLPSGWSGAQILDAYDLNAYRMTEMGEDVQIERFEAPIDIFVSAAKTHRNLSLAAQKEEEWVAVPAAARSLAQLGDLGLPAGRTWVATSVVELGPICLVQLPDPDQHAT